MKRYLWIVDELISETINRREQVKETSLTIVYAYEDFSGRRVTRKSTKRKILFFPSFDEAKAYIVDRAKKRIKWNRDNLP